MKVKILVLGKTRMGKSSFINYLLGKNVAEAKSGMSVTQKTTAYSAKVNGIDVEVYDTRGIEAKISDEMRNNIKRDIRRQNLNMKFQDRYHAIFYCVSMNNARFDSFEINLLTDITNEIKQPIHFILTNIDGNEDKLKGMEAHIRESLNNGFDNYTVNPVCSVNQRNADGSVSKQHGKEALLKHLFNSVWSDASVVMAHNCLEKYHNALNSFIDGCKNYIHSNYEHPKGTPNKKMEYLTTFIDTLPPDDIAENFKNEMKAILSDTDEYKDFIVSYYNIFGAKHVDKMFKIPIDLLENSSYSELKRVKYLIKYELKKEIKGIWGKLKYGLSPKNNFCDLSDMALSRICEEFDSDTVLKNLQERFNEINDNIRKSMDWQKIAETIFSKL